MNEDKTRRGWGGTRRQRRRGGFSHFTFTHIHSFSRSLSLLFHLCTHAVSTEIAFMCPSSVPLSLAPSFFFLLVFDLTLKMAGTHKRPSNSSISRSLTVTHALSIHHKWHTQQALIGWLCFECAGGEWWYILLTSITRSLLQLSGKTTVVRRVCKVVWEAVRWILIGF